MKRQLLYGLMVAILMAGPDEAKPLALFALAGYLILGLHKAYQRLARPKHNGYVYVIQDVDFSKLYKIGRTNNPEVRTRTFSVKLPFDFKVVHIIPCRDYVAAERLLHQRYASKRKRGEWFDLTRKDILDIRSIKSL